MPSHLLVLKYEFVKQIVCDEGFSDEINWQRNINFEDLNESTLLREIAWVILSTGMKEQIIRRLFKKISLCFFNWESAKKIIDNKQRCYNDAIQIFRNKRKISAIVESSEIVDEIGFSMLKKMISKDPIDTLKVFPFIGKTTVYHLAKNIGVCVAKPDRHLVRIAEEEGFNDVQDFCRTISDLSGDSVPVVDIVFWRFANLTRDYLEVLSTINFTK
ncbi:MAG: hypothetical protein ACTSU7_02520 [Candidatus Heimdallarchaeaceae archaeon]